VPALAVSVTVMEALSASWTVKPDKTVDTPTLAAYCVGTVALGGAAATLRLMVLGVSNVRLSLSLTATETLAEVQDRAAARPWADVARVFEEELGRHPRDVFAAIDEAPIAAASLAQVHRAVTLGGAEVAVKLQYPGLAQQVAGDMAAFRFFLAVLAAVYPENDYRWLGPEFTASAQGELAQERTRVALCSSRHATQAALVMQPSPPGRPAERALWPVEFVHASHS
jgi:hypothetical protein